MSEKTSLPLNHTEQVCRTEMYQPLHVAHSNYYSFASTQGDSKRFKFMFPNCPIAHGYPETDDKVKYNFQFGIAPYCKEQLIGDVKGHPFTFMFNSLVDKQYDRYVQY